MRGCLRLAGESWHASVASVWAHHVAEPVFLLLALAWTFVPAGRFRFLLLFLLSLLASAFEWSGYLVAFAFAVASILAAKYTSGAAFVPAGVPSAAFRRSAFVDSACIVVGSTAALAATLAHAAWSVGFFVWLDRVAARSGTRSVTLDTISDFPRMMGYSVGAWVLAAVLLVWLTLRGRVSSRLVGFRACLQEG